jgi:hypothetical protein
MKNGVALSRGYLAEAGWRRAGLLPQINTLDH